MAIRGITRLTSQQFCENTTTLLFRCINGANYASFHKVGLTFCRSKPQRCIRRSFSSFDFIHFHNYKFISLQKLNKREKSSMACRINHRDLQAELILLKAVDCEELTQSSTTQWSTESRSSSTSGRKCQVLA